MASRAAAERWLDQITALPTAPGLETEVIHWVEAWAGRRDDLRVRRDHGGNLHVRQKGRTGKLPVIAVAHMDHPAFVLTSVRGREAEYEFRGGVRPEYFPGATVELTSSPGRQGRVVEHDEKSNRGTILFSTEEARAGEIARWKLPKLASGTGLFQAPACDDLAGVAAALAALDQARSRPGLRHFSVLLTRAEEVGFVGAIHAARSGDIPPGARIISIEASRSSAQAPLGEGPVIRVGDASTVFDAELTNLISRSAARSGIAHQRKLMAGGSCEATAFGAFGYRTTGLCLPLENYHNMGNLDQVERGRARARAVPEVVSLSDFHGLVRLLLDAAKAVDDEWDLPQRLESMYEARRRLLDGAEPG